MRALVLLALLLAGSSTLQAPTLHKSRVVLRTSKGDVVLVLYPEVAPRHVEHFLRLVKSGFYDGTRFAYVQKGFWIQHAGYVDRLRPFNPEQARLDQVRVPAEFSSLRHVRGALSMARMPEDLDSATSVFAIMLGDVPSRDGLYTIFGRVEGGFDALEALESVPVQADGKPVLPVNLRRAFIDGENPDMTLVVAGFLMAAGLAAFLLSGRVLPRYAGPIGLSVVITGFFVGFVAVTPRVIEAEGSRPAMALVVFVSLLALFKLMNRFESPRS